MVLCVYMAMIQENMAILSMATWKTTKLCQALSRLARVEVCNLIMKTFYQDQTTRLAELQQLGLQMETTGRFSPETVRRWRVRPVCLTCPSMQFGQWQPRGVDTVTTLSCGCPRPRPVLVLPGVQVWQQGPGHEEGGVQEGAGGFL